jgi:hypothetical protein
MLSFGAAAAEDDEGIDEDLFAWHKPSAVSGGSASRLGASDENPFYATVALGFESNVFQVNNRFDNPVGVGFVDSNLDLSLPVKEIGEDVRFSLTADWKKYFRENRIDEYLVKPGVTFGGIDLGDATLELEPFVSLLRERIFNQFSTTPDHSDAGASGGMNWDLESDLSKTVNIHWTGETEYQTFFDAPNDNVRIETAGEVQSRINDTLELTGGTDWEFQRYRVRPHDLESQINPTPLATLEGRASIELKSHAAGGYALAVSLNAGPNIDLTNGYYNAAVIGAQAEFGRRIGNWKLTATIEPELVWFTQRPANLNKMGDKLFTQEYLFGFGVEYDWNKHVRIFCSDEIHLQESSSDESRSDAVLNSFTDNTVKIGMTVVF